MDRIMAFFVTGKIAEKGRKPTQETKKEFAIWFEKAKTIFKELGGESLPPEIGRKDLSEKGQSVFCGKRV